MELDEMLLAQHFRGSNRYFKIDEFHHHAFPIVEALHNDDSIDTGMYTKAQLFKLAVDIEKKRYFYVPKKKQTVETVAEKKKKVVCTENLKKKN